MEEDPQRYRGHTIERRVGEAAPVRAAVDVETEGEAAAELYIDGEPVFTFRDSAGMYLASGFAYSPQDSLTNLAKRIIDYRERIEEGGHGGTEESGQPERS